MINEVKTSIRKLALHNQIKLQNMFSLQFNVNGMYHKVYLTDDQYLASALDAEKRKMSLLDYYIEKYTKKTTLSKMAVKHTEDKKPLFFLD